MKLNLNETQLKKIKSAHSKKTGVTIQLSSRQIGTGNQEFALSTKQINKLLKSKKENKGSRLELEYEQIKQERHSREIEKIANSVKPIQIGSGIKKKKKYPGTPRLKKKKRKLVR